MPLYFHNKNQCSDILRYSYWKIYIDINSERKNGKKVWYRCTVEYDHELWCLNFSGSSTLHPTQILTRSYTHTLIYIYYINWLYKIWFREHMECIWSRFVFCCPCSVLMPLNLALCHILLYFSPSVWLLWVSIVPVLKSSFISLYVHSWELTYQLHHSKCSVLLWTYHNCWFSQFSSFCLNVKMVERYPVVVNCWSTEISKW